MKQPITLIFIFVALFSIANPLDIDDTAIIQTPSEEAQKICDFYEERPTQDRIDEVNEIIQTYEMYLSEDQIDAFVESDFSNINSKLMTAIMPHMIGVAFLIVLWPFLLCCCCCPESHPCCQSCRKPENQSYKKIQLKWPIVAAMVMCIIIMAGGAVGVSNQTQKIGDESMNTVCSIMRMEDAFMNGFISQEDDTRFFAGFTPILDAIKNFQAATPSDFLTDALTLDGVGSTLSALETAAKDEVDNLVLLPQTYSNAFTESDGTTYVDVDSIYETFFIPTESSSTIFGAFKEKLNVVSEQVNPINEAITEAMVILSDGAVGPGFDTFVGQLAGGMEIYNNALESARKKTADNFDFGSSAKSAKSGLQIPPLLFLAIPGLIIITLLPMLLCNMAGCRKFMYLLCFLLWIVTLIAFFLLIVFALLQPVIPQFCKYLDTKFQTGEGLLYFVDNIDVNQFAQATYTDCAPDGTGNILKSWYYRYDNAYGNAQVGTNVWGAITAVSYYAQRFDQLAPNSVAAQLTNIDQDLIDQIDKIRVGSRIDVNDSVATSFLSKLARKDFPVDAACTSNVEDDSFVPAFDSGISCYGKEQQDPCPNLGNTGLCPTGCYEIYRTFYTDGSYSSNIDTRYGASCNYNSLLTDLHDNWNIPRQALMDSVEGDFNTYKTSHLNPYTTAINNIQTAYSDASNNFQADFDPILVDPQFGTFGGCDCRLIQQKLQIIRDTACVGLVPYLKNAFTCFLLAAWGGLFFMCFGVCVGVRQYKNEKYQKVAKQISPHDQPSQTKFLDQEPRSVRKKITVEEFELPKSDSRPSIRRR